MVFKNPNSRRFSIPHHGPPALLLGLRQLLPWPPRVVYLCEWGKVNFHAWQKMWKFETNHLTSPSWHCDVCTSIIFFSLWVRILVVALARAVAAWFWTWKSCWTQPLINIIPTHMTYTFGGYCLHHLLRHISVPMNTFPTFCLGRSWNTCHQQ